MKVALVYDRVNKWGGAERTLLALHEIFPKAPLYTSIYFSKKAEWAKVFPKVIPSFLNGISFLQNKHELLGTFMPIVFETFDFSDYDLVISVTSEAAKGIITKPGTVHICYCLTPTRYLWSQYDFYFRNPVFKFISKPVINYLRNWDKVAAQRPDTMIAISSAVKERIHKYYQRESKIIFPPVNVSTFVPDKNKKGEYYLFVSRLIPYKRPDLVIKAFNKLNKPLKVVGTGSEERSLKRIAKRNIEFAGQVSDEKLVEYYREAKALVFPGEEDFGIVMVEALAAGAPVIAYKKGGALDIVKEGVTGVFFEEQSENSLINAIEKFERMEFNSQTISKNVLKFSKERFKEEFMQLVENVTSGQLQ